MPALQARSLGLWFARPSEDQNTFWFSRARITAPTDLIITSRGEMKNFYTDVILKSPWAHNSHEVCKDPKMLEPGFRAKVLALIASAHAAGHELRIMETYRSQSRQHQLFLKGFTKLSHVGCHGYGLAADLGLFINGTKYDPKGEDYMFMVALCAKHGLISGIDWGVPGPHSFRDWDHCQLPPIFRQNALFTGSWYPSPTYDPIQDQINQGIA